MQADDFPRKRDFHAKGSTLRRAGNRDSAETSHVYQSTGYDITTLTLEDAAGQKSIASNSVLVNQNRPPQINGGLSGTGSMVSRVLKRSLAFDSEGDSLTISVAPVSAGLIFHTNAAGDSGIYYLADRDDRSTRAEFTQLDRPSTADRKLDWQVVFDTPRFDNTVEEKYFVMPQ